jgi:parvulin-like peptidyl-prolyl isomerase
MHFQLPFLVQIQALVLGFALVFGTLAQAEVIDRLEASVNASIILKSDLDHFRKTVKLRGQIDPLFSLSSIATTREKSSDPAIQEYLIDNKTVLAYAPISDSEVDIEINNRQTELKITRNQLRQALAREGFLFEDYFEFMRESLSKRTVFDREIRPRVFSSEDDIRAKYKSLYGEQKQTRKLKAGLIALKVGNYKSVKVAEGIAEKLRQEIVSGEKQWAEVARQNSDDPSSQHGGILEDVSEDDLNPELAKVLRTMKKGDVSKPVMVPKRGLYILTIFEATPADSAHYLQVRDEIRNQLTTAEFQKQFKYWLDNQKATAYIHRRGEPTF